jgi:Gas vesicle protein
VNPTPIQQTNTLSNANRTIATFTQRSTLADILERVLDKGIVIPGDISVSITSTELLHIRIRLLISSFDREQLS